MKSKFKPEEKLVVQVVHAANPENAQVLKSQIDNIYKPMWFPLCRLSLVLGAHTGSSLVGVCYAPAAVFEGF